MEPIKLPTLPNVVNSQIVTVHASELQSIVDTVNELVGAYNAQQVQLAEVSQEVVTLKENMSKVAEILEALYEKT